MSRKNTYRILRGFLYGVLCVIMFLIALGASGANYSTKNNINGKFEETSTWNGGSLPGNFVVSTTSYFNVEENADITINGKVYLNGSLNLLETSRLTLAENSTLVIDGNLNISDLSRIKTSPNSNLYIKGDLITHDINDDNNGYGWYVLFDMWNQSNIVVEGNLTSTLDADVVIYPGTQTDFYVFKNTSGTIYRTTGNGYANETHNDIDNQRQFNRNDAAVLTQVNNLTSILSETYSYNSYVENCVLNIQENTQIEIPSDAVVKLTNITMQEGAKLVNNGTIKIVESCESDTYADFDFASGCYNNTNPYNGTNPISFVNNGEFKCKKYSQKVTMANRPIYWTNTGKITCSDDFIIDIGQNHYFNTLCGSSISAENMNFYSQKELTLDGIYTCEIMTIDLENGGNTVNFGSDCPSTDISVMNKLVLKHNISYLNIEGISTLNGIDALDVYSNVAVEIDGELYVGNTTNKVTITGGENSQITLCYNEKMSLHKTDITSTNNESSGDGYARTKGVVKFRVPIDGENIEDSHAWYYNLPCDEYNGNSSNTGDPNNMKFDVLPLNQYGDPNLVNHNVDFIANKVSYTDCINRQFVQGSLMPIELTYFKLSGNNFEWETESEENNDYFVVEYSKNGTEWAECTGHIHSQSNTGWVYDCIVPESTKGSTFSYYRLKQVDFDGKHSYSDIISMSWKVVSPQYPDKEHSKSFITIDGKILYDYGQLPAGMYIEKSENGIRRIVKLK